MSHQCWVERKDHLPPLAGNGLPSSSQDTVGLLCCESTLLAHGQFGVFQVPQGLFCQANFQSVGPRLAWFMGFFFASGRTWRFPFLKFMRFLSPISLACLRPSGWQHNHQVYQLLLPGFLSSATLLRVFSVPSSKSLMKIWNTGCRIDFWDTALVTGLQLNCVTDHKPLSPSVQPVFNPFPFFSSSHSPYYLHFLWRC